MRQELNRIYLKYKKQAIPLLFVSMVFFIIFRVIIPQLSSISESNQMISEKTAELETLNKSISVLSSLNDSDLTSNLSLTTKALPTSKDISMIFTALTSAASASNTELKEFSLKVGGVYGRSLAKSIASNVKGVPSLSVIARLSSQDAKALVQFSKELKARLPLSEIKTIDASSNFGSFEISFFYKPADLTLISKQDKVNALGQADLNLLNQLKEWDK